MKFEVNLTSASGTKERVVELEGDGQNRRILLDGQPMAADALVVAPNTISILLDGHSYEVHVAASADGSLKLQSGAHEFSAAIQDTRAWRGRKHGAVEAVGRQQILAPMAGKVIRLLVTAGEAVEAGQGLVVVEAMKMQNEIRSPKGGKVERLLVREGQNVTSGEVLAWVE